MNEEIQKIEGDATAGSADAESETGAELEKLRRENLVLKQVIRMRAADERITRELVDAGARSPKLLFETFKDRIEFDENDEPLNVPHLVRDLKKMYPEQFDNNPPLRQIDAAAGVRAKQTLITHKSLSMMSPQEIAKLDWAEVRSILAAGE
ncbi:hypothetical protein [Leptolyngbya sp. 7M]|uniref:hypothetical protein n=1 Tax=Leptolyngbya sp. 7M TaxID=2812896 RepID=UPI001B8D2A6D|nr:hypothetical protein [Leptolyngbya sp. 7M]QYO62316.1 hypothetical protein JVX88_19685 [Leptolyngbya sp. 7M]